MCKIVFIFSEKGGVGKTITAVGLINEMIKIKSKSNVLAINLDESSYSLEAVLSRYNLLSKVDYRNESFDTLNRCLENEIRNNKYNFVVVDFKGSEIDSDFNYIEKVFDKANVCIIPIIPSVSNITAILKALDRMHKLNVNNKIKLLINLHGAENLTITNLVNKLNNEYKSYHLLTKTIEDVRKHDDLINVFNKQNRETFQYLIQIINEK